MKSILVSIWNDIKQGENIDLYISVFVSVLLVLLNFFGFATAVTSTVTLSVLGLMSISTLVSRRKTEKILEKLNEPSTKFFLDRFPAERESVLINSKEILLMGAVLNKTVHHYYPILEDKLRNGHNIRVLVTDPSGTVLESVARQQYKPTDAQELKSYLLLTLSSLEKLHKKFPENLEIRTINHPVQFGALVANTKTIDGVIFVELYSFKMERDAPIFSLNFQNRVWFDFYNKQIENIWSNATDWKRTGNNEI